MTAVDSDPEVFPFLDLHAEINRVEIMTMKRGLGGVAVEDLRDFNVLVGADICFWDNLTPVLKRLINRAPRPQHLKPWKSRTVLNCETGSIHRARTGMLT